MKLTTIPGYGTHMVYDCEYEVPRLFEFIQTLFQLIERNSDLEFTSVEWCEGDEETYGGLRFDIERRG